MSSSNSWDAVLSAAVDELAVSNARALDSLFRQLRVAVYEADLDTLKVAEAIGVTEEEAYNLLGGGVDITLSDLEVLLVAARGRLALEVTPERIHERSLKLLQETVTANWRTGEKVPVRATGNSAVWRTVHA